MTNQSLRGSSDRGCLVSAIITAALIISMLLIAAANPQPPTSAPIGTQVVANAVQPATEETTVEAATEVAAVVEETPTAEPTVEVTAQATAAAAEPTAEATEAASGAAVAMASSFDPELAAQGESLFPLCAACHGADGRGVPGLGKDLVDSEFVTSLSDDELTQFIIVGRPSFDPANTTGVDMPPKGGNPALTEDDIHAIVAYIRKLHADFAGVSTEAGSEAADTTATEAPASAAVADAAAPDPELVARGQSLFPLCAACHGANGQGVPGLGKDLVDSEFVASLSDDELTQFIITGRPSFDPANTTGIDMPPKGGNPALTEDDIHAIVAYIRQLHLDAAGS